MKEKIIQSEVEMKALGEEIAKSFKGGECVELIGDVGAGKTTLIKGIAKGLESVDEVQSPSFTINRVYRVKDDLEIYHYDFYRLHDVGIIQHELEESVNDSHKITLIEWGESIRNILPKNHTTIHITALSENSRKIIMGKAK